MPRLLPTSTYFILPMFTAKQIFIQAFNNASACISILILSPIKLTPSNRHYMLGPKLVYCTFLVVYSKAEFNSSGDKTCLSLFGTISQYENKKKTSFLLSLYSELHVLINRILVYQI